MPSTWLSSNNVLTQIERLDGTTLEVLEQLAVASSYGAAGVLHSVIAVMRKVPADRLPVNSSVSLTFVKKSTILQVNCILRATLGFHCLNVLLRFFRRYSVQASVLELDDDSALLQ